jgi:striatin 1/3/4
VDINPVATYRGHTGPLTSLAVSLTGKTIYTTSVDATIRSWRVPDLNVDPYEPYDSLVDRVFIGHTDIVWDILCHPVEQILVTSSADETVKVWNSKTSSVVHTFREELVEPSMICWSSGFKYVCVGSASGSIRFFNLDTQSLVRSIKVDGRVTSVAIDHESGLLAVASDDKNICLFDSRESSGKEVYRLSAHTGAVTCVSFGDGTSLVSGGMRCCADSW